jgi:hypothetical protein
MRDGEDGQPVGDALGQYSNFNAYNSEQAYVLDSVGAHQLDLIPLGKGLHAIADNTSPAHFYFQPWDYNPVHILQHIAKESTIDPAQFVGAVQDMLKYYDDTFKPVGLKTLILRTSVVSLEEQIAWNELLPSQVSLALTLAAFGLPVGAGF